MRHTISIGLAAFALAAAGCGGGGGGRDGGSGTEACDAGLQHRYDEQRAMLNDPKTPREAKDNLRDNAIPGTLADAEAADCKLRQSVKEKGWSEADLREAAAVYRGVLNRTQARCMAEGWAQLYPSLKALDTHDYDSIDESLEEERMIADLCDVPAGKL